MFTVIFFILIAARRNKLLAVKTAKILIVTRKNHHPIETLD